MPCSRSITSHLFAIAAALLPVLATPVSAAPLCERIATHEMVPCWSDAKIDDAVKLLRSRGIAIDRATVISIEVNRGQFVSARALADWIEHGD